MQLEFWIIGVLDIANNIFKFHYSIIPALHSPNNQYSVIYHFYLIG